MMRLVLFAVSLCIHAASDIADDAEVPVGILPEDYFKAHPGEVDAVKAMTPAQKATWMNEKQIQCNLVSERNSRRQLLFGWVCQEDPAKDAPPDSPRPAKKSTSGSSASTPRSPRSVIPAAASGGGGVAATLVVYFIRHAESTWNQAKANHMQLLALPFSCDSPLTDDGVTQTLLWNNAQMKGTTIGQELVQKIGASAITFFSSPLQRTYETVSSMFNSLGGAQNTRTLHLIPSLRETTHGWDAQSHVMGQCRNIQGFLGKEAGSHQDRTEKFLKEGRSLDRLRNYANYWQSLNFVEEENSEFGDYNSATSSPDASYFEPFLNDLFTITQREGKDSALVSTHSHWIEDFASHVVAGDFGPAPGGNWAHYTTAEGKVLNAHVIRVQITRTAEGRYTFGAQIEEAPPSGTKIQDFAGASVAVGRAQDVQTHVRVAAPLSRMHVILFGFIVATLSLCYLVWFLKSRSSHGDRLLADFDHI